MTAELLTSKIELLQEQIENIERSGFFTENEIDRAVVSLKSELELHKMHLSYCELSVSAQLDTISIVNLNLKAIGLARLAPGNYGMSDEQYEEGRKKHLDLFIKNQEQKDPNTIDVIDAEIVTPSYTNAV